MISRRNLLLGGAALTLSGCKVLDGLNSGDSLLRATLQGAEYLTMTAQRLLLGDRLAPEFAEVDIRQGQHPNGSISVDSPEYQDMQAQGFASYHLQVTGMVAQPLSIPFSTLTAMPSRTQITRHDCVEGWSCIAKWTGVALSHILDQAKPLPNARYAVFHCFDTIERTLAGEVTYYTLITSGDDLLSMTDFINSHPAYTAEDAIAYLST